MDHASPFQTSMFQEPSNDIRTPQSNGIWPLQSLSKNLGVRRNSNSQSGSSLGNVKVHSLVLFCIPGNMKHDSQTSLLARTFASLCFGHKPKAKVATGSIFGCLINLRVKLYMFLPKFSTPLEEFNLLAIQMSKCCCCLRLDSKICWLLLV
jgi:hypothetical protein